MPKIISFTHRGMQYLNYDVEDIKIYQELAAKIGQDALDAAIAAANNNRTPLDVLGAQVAALTLATAEKDHMIDALGKQVAELTLAIQRGGEQV